MEIDSKHQNTDEIGSRPSRRTALGMGVAGIGVMALPSSVYASSPSSSNADTPMGTANYVVGPTVGVDGVTHTTIQAAVTAAQLAGASGMRIDVRAGTYVEAVSIPNSTGTTNLTINGPQAGVTAARISRAGGEAVVTPTGADTAAFTIQAQGVTLNGLSMVRNPTANGNNGFVKMEPTSPLKATIVCCRIIGNGSRAGSGSPTPETATYELFTGRGILISTSRAALDTHPILIRRNWIEGWLTGVSNQNSSFVKYEQNTFYRNRSAYSGDGVLNNEVVGNLFEENLRAGSYAGTVSAPCTISVTGNSYINNTRGTAWNDLTTAMAGKSLFRQNTFAQVPVSGDEYVRVTQTSGTAVAANSIDIEGNYWGQATGPEVARLGTSGVAAGNAIYDYTPYYTDAGLTTLSS